MTKYLVKIPYNRRDHDHWQAQSHHMAKFHATGLRHESYKWVSATSASGVDYHTWKITCTDEQLSFLIVSCGGEVQHNLTKQAMLSGLKKLEPEEIEALGLTELWEKSLL